MFAIFPVIIPFPSHPFPFPALLVVFWGRVPDRKERNEQRNETNKERFSGLLWGLVAFIYRFGTLVLVWVLGAFWGKKKRLRSLFLGLLPFAPINRLNPLNLSGFFCRMHHSNDTASALHHRNRSSYIFGILALASVWVR